MDKQALYVVNNWPGADAAGLRDVQVTSDSVTVITYSLITGDGKEADAVIPFDASRYSYTDFGIKLDEQGRPVEPVHGFGNPTEYTFTLDKLKSDTSFQDASVYLLYADRFTNDARGIFNLNSLSCYPRIPTRDMRHLLSGISPIAFLYVESESTVSFLDMKWVFSAPKSCPVSTNLETVESPEMFEANGLFIDYFPKFSLTEKERKQDGTIVVEATCLHQDGTPNDRELSLYVDSSSGYLPKRKIPITHKVIFTIMPLGLNSGDEILVKVGYRFWQNLSSLKLVV